MPLIIPDHYRTYRIMGIDPGLNNTGVSTFDVEAGTDRIVAISAFTLINDKLVNHTGLDEETHTERYIKLYKLKHALQMALAYTGPCWVACEAPFYNRLRPTAYAPLVEVVNQLYAALIEFNPNIGFTLFPPLTVKKIVGARSIKNDTEKGKIEVKDAIQRVPEIMSVLQTPIQTLSEHAIDSIAVGYTWVKNKDQLP